MKKIEFPTTFKWLCVCVCKCVYSFSSISIVFVYCSFNCCWCCYYCIYYCFYFQFFRSISQKFNYFNVQYVKYYLATYIVSVYITYLPFFSHLFSSFLSLQFLVILLLRLLLLLLPCLYSVIELFVFIHVLLTFSCIYDNRVIQSDFYLLITVLFWCDNVLIYCVLLVLNHYSFIIHRCILLLSTCIRVLQSIFLYVCISKCLIICQWLYSTRDVLKQREKRKRTFT